MSIKLSNNFGNVRSLFCSPGLGLLKGFILIDHSFKSSSKINDHVVFVDVANSTVSQGPVCHAHELTIICGRAVKG